MLFLYGIKSRDLDNIMEYFYNGKAQMYQDEMDSFLKLAVKLKIPGLQAKISTPPQAQKENPSIPIPIENNSIPIPIENPSIPIPIEKKLLKLEPVNVLDTLGESLNDDDVIDDPLAFGDDTTEAGEYVEGDEEEMNLTLDINAITKEAEAITKKSTFDINAITKEAEAITKKKLESTVVGKVKPHFSQYVDKIGTGVNGSYVCRLCKGIVADQTKLRDHIENHIYGLSYPCHQCGKEFKSNVVLANHLQSKHYGH